MVVGLVVCVSACDMSSNMKSFAAEFWRSLRNDEPSVGKTSRSCVGL